MDHVFNEATPVTCIHCGKERNQLALQGQTSCLVHDRKESLYKDLQNIFTSHVLNAEQRTECEILRHQALELASQFVDICPPSRELDCALIKLREAVFWATASISCRS